MRIELTKILLLAMILSGIIIPIHAYDHDLADTKKSHSIEIDVQHDTDDDSISCDHCCHFSSHSLGLMQKNSMITDREVDSNLIFQRQKYASYNPPPPYHPPIA